MKKVTVENERIRVTVPQRVYDELGKEGVLGEAVKVLDNRSKLALLEKNDKIPFEEVRELAESMLIIEHLKENCPYNLAAVLTRMSKGVIINPSMEKHVAYAKAYAQGILNPMSAKEAREQAMRVIEDGMEKPANWRELTRLKLATTKDAPKREVILNEAFKILSQERGAEIVYRREANNPVFEIEIIRREKK